MSDTHTTANIPKIGLELEGCVTTCHKEMTRKAIPGKLEDYLKTKFTADELGFELYDFYTGAYNRFEMKSEPSEDVMDAVMSLSECIEDVQYQTAKFYRAQYQERIISDDPKGSLLNQRMMFSGMPPDGNLMSGEAYTSGLHIHAELPEAERKDVAERITPYTTVLAGLTLSSPFGNCMAEQYSTRLMFIAESQPGINSREEHNAFRMNHLKNNEQRRAMPRPDTLELTLCDSTSDPRAIAATAAIYQALVMKARQGDMEAERQKWCGVEPQIKQLAHQGYEESFNWKGHQAMFPEMVDDVLREVRPQLEQCGTVEIAEYARHIALGHTCAHKQKQISQDFIAHKMKSLGDFDKDMPDSDKEYWRREFKGRYAQAAEKLVEKDVAYRSLRLHREARAMFEEHCPDACQSFTR